jgi:hypothetical protein
VLAVVAVLHNGGQQIHLDHAFTGDVKVLQLKASDYDVVGRFDECGQDAKCCPAENKTAPKPSQSEKPEAAVERLKPLWLCGLWWALQDSNL